MVARVPAQIPKLPPRLPAPPSLRSLPVVTTHHPLPPVFRPPLCFHTLTNPPSRKPFIFTSIQIPRGCGGISVWLFTSHRSRVTSHVLSFGCRLFVASSRSFLHSFPLFSRACGLFCKTPGVGGRTVLAEASSPSRSATPAKANAPIRVSGFACSLFDSCGARVRWSPLNLGTKP